MKNDRIKQFFLEHPKSDVNIINFCIEEYEARARKKGSLLNSNYLEKLVRQTCKELGISKTSRDSILKSLFHTALSYRVRAGMQSNKAPIFHPSKHLALIKHLWTARPPSIYKTFVCRMVAVQAILCLYSFRRWVDVSRLRWEHCDKVVTMNRTFYKFNLGASKTNTKGQRNEYITVQQQMESDICPVEMLKLFWKISGCPKTGWLFPCIHKKRSFTTNSLYQHWDAYTCTGHKSNKLGKVPCMGEVNGNTSFGYYERAAKRLKWKTLPHKHSFRRAGIVIANKLNVPRERITEFFGWKHDSSMISLYLQEELATTSQGLAWKFTDALKSNLDCLQDISFAE